MLQFSVQMTGVSCIQYYSPQIFAAIGFAKEKTFLFQVSDYSIALAVWTGLTRLPSDLELEWGRVSTRSLRLSLRVSACSSATE